MGNIDKFELAATQYDTAARVEVAAVIAGAIAASLAGEQLKTAVDYGCGTGLVGLRLLDKFESLVLVDASQNMIAEVKRKIEAEQIKNADALCLDLMAAQPSALHADCVIVSQVLLHEKDTRTLLARLSAVLDDGGLLCIVDFDKNDAVVSTEVHPGFVQDELIGLLRELSFSDIQARTFYEGKALFMNQDASLFLLTARKGNPSAF